MLDEKTFPPGPRGPRAVLQAFLRFVENPPLQMLEHRHTWGQAMGFRIGSRQMVLLADPALIGEVLLDKEDVFIKDRVTRGLQSFLGQGLLTSEGALWKKQRKLIAPRLTKKHISTYADTMTRCAKTYADGLRDGAVEDVHGAMTRVTLEIVTETLFGTTLGTGHDEVGHAIDELMQNFEEVVHSWRQLFPDWVPFKARRRSAITAKAIDRAVFAVIAKKRAEKKLGDDLLSRLLEAQDDEGAKMGDVQLRDEAVTMFVAGHETTANALGFTLMLLGDHPEVDARAYEEVARVLGEKDAKAEHVPQLTYLDAVMKESMRLYPPAHIIGRESTRTVKIGPWVIPPRTTILMSPWALHHDATFWPDPLAFRPSRWLDGSAEKAPKNAYLPFGGGPRVCIGNHFATMESILVLATVLQKARFERAHVDEVKLQPAITLRPRSGIRMRAKLRSAKAAAA
ncbi:MAG TPA: cytochrome P450 [Polyangiaceae bacterium]